MTDDAVLPILRNIQHAMAAQGRKLDALTGEVESLGRKIDEVARETRAIRVNAATYEDLNRLENRVAELEGVNPGPSS